jgi:glucose/arabinose dehydrogenase
VRRLLRILLIATTAVVLVLGVAIATRSFWLPERFAVNVPVRTIMGAKGGAVDTSTRSLKLPPGFHLTAFAQGLENARLLRVTARGDVLVSQPRTGRVTLLLADRNGDGVSDGSLTLVEGLDRPHGLALREGFLYIAEMTAVGRIAFDQETRKVSGAFTRVITGLPAGGNHWTRTIGFGPDGYLYLSVGSSCNVCIEADPRRAAISRYDPANWQGKVYATGLRNSVGFAWRTTIEGGTSRSELIATDNGRDLLGNDFPPCELNRIVEGGFYGWPFANGNRVADPDFGAGHEKEIASSLPPIHGFAAHNAPLGIAFLDAASTPAAYRGAALVALHGSWNRTRKDGYKVVSLHWEADGNISERDFLTGFLVDDDVSGRPVDVAQGDDGTIYISDDYSGSVFRVSAGSGPEASAVKGRASADEAAQVVRAPLDPAAIARGEKTFRENRCETCHDSAFVGRPGKATKALQQLQARYDVEKLVTYFRTPQPPMPLFEMSDAERRDLAAYVLNRFR